VRFVAVALTFSAAKQLTIVCCIQQSAGGMRNALKLHLGLRIEKSRWSDSYAHNRQKNKNFASFWFWNFEESG